VRNVNFPFTMSERRSVAIICRGRHQPVFELFKVNYSPYDTAAPLVDALLIGPVSSASYLNDADRMTRTHASATGSTLTR
jgi:hypothetical protein